MAPWGSVARQHLDVLQTVCSLPWSTVTELDPRDAVPGHLSKACWMPGSLSSHGSLRAAFSLAIPWVVAPPFPSLPVTITHFISIVAVITRLTVALSVSSLLFHWNVNSEGRDLICPNVSPAQAQGLVYREMPVQ